MTAYSSLPATFPRVPLKQMDSSMLIFELDRETLRLMPESTELITSAATLASFLHRKQTRFVRGDLPQVPYIEHPLRVALRLIRWGIHDATMIAAALLHDVVEDAAEELLEVFGTEEDYGSAHECLRRLYGPQIAHLVRRLTNPVATEGKTTLSYHEHVAELARSGSVALLIKASDLKDNAGSIRHQLGHGQDKKLLRLIGKYYSVTKLFSVEMRVRQHNHDLALTNIKGIDGVLEIVADEMNQLANDLTALTVEHQIKL